MHKSPHAEKRKRAPLPLVQLSLIPRGEALAAIFGQPESDGFSNLDVLETRVRATAHKNLAAVRSKEWAAIDMK
jgi:hypothetical protein